MSSAERLGPPAGAVLGSGSSQGRTVFSSAPAASLPVVLRPWRAEDLPVFREWLRPHHEWHRWDGPYFPRPTEEQADAWVERLAQALGGRDEGEKGDEGEGGLDAGRSTAEAPAALPPRDLVVADAVDGSFCGRVSWYWESEETEWARMGLTLFDPALRGRGAGRSALALWTSLLFEMTAWRRLDFATWSGNTAMCTVGDRLGFTREATFRRARVVDGQVYDSVVYGVLREEWQASAEAR